VVASDSGEHGVQASASLRRARGGVDRNASAREIVDPDAEIAS